MVDREIQELAGVINKKYERGDIEVIDAENLYKNQLARKDKEQIILEDDTYSSSSKTSLWKFEHQVFFTRFLANLNTNQITEKKEQHKYNLLYKLSIKEYHKILISEKEKKCFIFYFDGRITTIPITKKNIKCYKSNQLTNYTYNLMGKIVAIHYNDLRNIYFFTDQYKFYYINQLYNKRKQIFFKFSIKDDVKLLTQKGNLLIFKNLSKENPENSHLVFFNARNQKILMRSKKLKVDSVEQDILPNNPTIIGCRINKVIEYHFAKRQILQTKDIKIIVPTNDHYRNYQKLTKILRNPYDETVYITYKRSSEDNGRFSDTMFIEHLKNFPLQKSNLQTTILLEHSGNLLKEKSIIKCSRRAHPRLDMGHPFSDFGNCKINSDSQLFCNVGIDLILYDLKEYCIVNIFESLAQDNIKYFDFTRDMKMLFVVDVKNRLKLIQVL